MPRLTALLLALMLLLAPAQAEDTPLTLRSASSIAEVETFLLLPQEDTPAPVQPGYLRYISQSQKRDASFCKEYWLGGEEGSVLDLTLKERYGVTFDFHAGIMCTRAAYSMVLSYFGIDMTPGDMSRVTGNRNLYEPYTEISEMVGVEQVRVKANRFNTMVDNYLTDESYSPVYLYFQKPNGTNHAVLVVAHLKDQGRYLVVDSSPFWVNGQPHRVFFISLNKARSKIINSTFYDEMVGSTVLQVQQWRLVEPPPDPEAESTASPT